MSRRTSGHQPESAAPSTPSGPAASSEPVDRADRVRDRLAIPVLIAALASIPAIFLTLLDDPWETIGTGINSLSGAVLVLETVVLLALADDRRRWLRRNRWLVALTIVIIPAVIFAVGPVQLLRLVRVVGAIRIVRVGRILKAGRILRDRFGINRWWERAIGLGVTLLCAAFVAVILADPTSSTRQQLIDPVVDATGLPMGALVAAAGLILGIATFVVARARGEEAPDPTTPPQPTTAPHPTTPPRPTPQAPTAQPTAPHPATPPRPTPQAPTAQPTPSDQSTSTSG